MPRTRLSLRNGRLPAPGRLMFLCECTLEPALMLAAVIYQIVGSHSQKRCPGSVTGDSALPQQARRCVDSLGCQPLLLISIERRSSSARVAATPTITGSLSRSHLPQASLLPLLKSTQRLTLDIPVLTRVVSGRSKLLRENRTPY